MNPGGARRFKRDEKKGNSPREKFRREENLKHNDIYCSLIPQFHTLEFIFVCLNEGVMKGAAAHAMIETASGADRPEPSVTNSTRTSGASAGINLFLTKR
jgi:hypothetical protein